MNELNNNLFVALRAAFPADLDSTAVEVADGPTAGARYSWAGLGANPPNAWGPDFGRFVGSEIKRWAEVVKGSGAKLD